MSQSNVIPPRRLEILKARLIDDLARGTIGELKDCIYVMNEDVIEDGNREGKVTSFNLAVDRKMLLERNWWLGSVEEAVQADDPQDLMIAKFVIVDSPASSGYRLEGIHADTKLASDAAVTKHAIFLSQVDVLVPILGKCIAKKGASFIREQVTVAGHYKYVVCSTKALLFQTVDDIMGGGDQDTYSINMGNCFPWSVDYEKTSTYTGLCFYKI
jgi:hypothetical protein